MQRTADPGHPAAAISPRSAPSARVLLCVLASAAGCTDAVNYIVLGHVFTANMTGNTVLLGIAIVAGKGAQVARSACALVAFCSGVALSARFVSCGARAGVWPRRASVALALEALLLALLGALGTHFGVRSAHAYWLIGLSGFAMGTQSAAVRVIDIPDVATTYITGTLTNMVMLAVAGTDGSTRPSRRRRHVTTAVAASIWGVYLAAALAGAAAADAIGVRAIWIAAAIAAGVSVAASLPARRRIS